MYANGALQQTVTGYTYNASSPGELSIGDFGSNSEPWSGTIDEVKIYNFALTASEVKLDMNRGSSQVLGSLSDNSTYQKSAANQEYCVPGDSTSCAAPVGRWGFEEMTSTVLNDSSGNTNTGTITIGASGTQTSTSQYWRGGKIGGAVNFDGTDDYVSVADSASLQLTNALTVSAWFKSQDTTANRGIIRKDTETGTRYLYGLSLNATGSANKLTAQYYNGANFAVASSGSVNDGLWHFGLMTISGTTLTLYVDGVSQGTATITGTQGAPTGELDIGANPPYVGPNAREGFLTGMIDDVRIFNYARTGAQVAWDYNRGKPVGWWKLDECQGTTLNDSSGNANSATISIGATGTYTSAGTCASGTSTHAWAGGAAGAGKRNYVLSLDGTDDYAYITDNSILEPTTAITVSAWLYRTSTWAADARAMVSKETAGTNGYMLYSADTYTPYLFVYGPSVTNATLTTAMPLNGWLHAVFTYDGANIKGYANGALETTVASTGSIVTNALNVWIGRYNSSTTKYFPGKIDDVRIYNYPLVQVSRYNSK